MIIVGICVIAVLWIGWIIYEFVNAPLISDDEDWIDPEYQEALKDVSDEK